MDRKNNQKHLKTLRTCLGMYIKAAWLFTGSKKGDWTTRERILEFRPKL